MPRRAGHRQRDESAARSRAFWSGTISFGLVAIPVELYSATHGSRQALRLIAPSGQPVARRYFGDGEEPLPAERITRGYLFEGEYVPVTEEELEALAPEQSRNIELSRFVDRNAISPLFFEHAYVMAPTGASTTAYHLLAATLEKTGKAGIARFVMRAKQYPVAIFGEGGLLRAHTLRFADELRTPQQVGLAEGQGGDGRELAALRALLRKHRLPGAPRKLLGTADEYEAKVEALVREKQRQRRDLVRVTESAAGEGGGQLADVIDLVAILKESLNRDRKNAAPGTATTAKAKAKSRAKRPAPRRP